MQYVLADSGLWYALIDARDEHHARAQEHARYLEWCQIVLPWPILYETIRTRLTRNKKAFGLLEDVLNIPGIIFLDDVPFREAALKLALESSLRGSRPLSLVDCVIRLILDDVNTKIDYFVTFNPKDFSDVCRRRGIEMA